ncbi:MAG TPA: PAS domain S-box protein, partial [Gemmatimonadaceae bacterium]
MTKRHILIVDDDAVVARQLEHRLNSLGYEVTAIASSAHEARVKATELEPDLLLIDLALRDEAISVRAGDELQRRKAIPTIVMIDETTEAALNRAGAAERDVYVVKPFTDRELRATIDLAFCRHEAARAVHDLEDRFFAVSVDMLCFLDFTGYFKRLNPAWERTLGFSRQELMSKPFIEFVHPDDRERTLNQNKEVRGGGQALSFENRYLCKDGSYRWFRWNAAPDAGQRVIYSVARDVTASKQADEERERLVTELQSALAEVKTLREILPICSYCRKIRDDANYWHTVEGYIAEHTSTR